MESDAALLAVLETLALRAGRVVLDRFRGDFAVLAKSDRSPVTEADRTSEALILEGLHSHFPGIACVAEEEAAAGFALSDPGREFFLVDPLDGTREFVNRREDFTVNIALVRDGAPILGVVFAPASGRLYSGRPGRAESVAVTSEFAAKGRSPIRARVGATPLSVVASRSHRTAETDAYIRDLGVVEILSVGSSLKFCLIASGEADVYPRFGPTMEWDTAAGDAVLRAAGGMTRSIGGAPLVYGNKSRFGGKDFANPFFIAAGKELGAVL